MLQIPEVMIVAISGIQRRAIRIWTDVSEERIDYFVFENQLIKKPALSGGKAEFSFLKMEMIRLSEASVYVRTIRSWTPEDS
jgi:hypothetical protein